MQKKKKHLKGGITGRHGRQPACWTGNSWFNSNTKRKHTGNGLRNGLPRGNREILPGYVSTEWGRPKTCWNQQPEPAWRKMLTGEKGIKSFPCRWSDIGRGCSEHWSILALQGYPSPGRVRPFPAWCRVVVNPVLRRQMDEVVSWGPFPSWNRCVIAWFS